MGNKKKAISPYYVITLILLAAMAVFFLFPLYWIITGSVKEKSDIIIKSGEMVKWFPTTITWDNHPIISDLLQDLKKHHLHKHLQRPP